MRFKEGPVRCGQVCHDGLYPNPSLLDVLVYTTNQHSNKAVHTRLMIDHSVQIMQEQGPVEQCSNTTIRANRISVIDL